MIEITNLLLEKNNFHFLIKKIEIQDINLINKFYEFGIRQGTIIHVSFNNNKNIITVNSRGANYAIRINELKGIFGEIYEQ